MPPVNHTRRFGQTKILRDTSLRPRHVTLRTHRDARAFAPVTWKKWERREGAHGEDVLQIVVDSNTLAVLKIAKTERSSYVAIGFDGWGLTVCDDFDKLLDILARMSSSSCVSDLRSWTTDAAA